MAVRSCCYPAISIPRFETRRAKTLRVSSTSVHSSNAHLSIAATPIKEFEDQVRGIVCYRDEKGELICEGYDEGPRYGMRLPEKACFPWPKGIQFTDFVELTTLRVFEDADVLPLKKDQKRHI